MSLVGIVFIRKSAMLQFEKSSSVPVQELVAFLVILAVCLENQFAWFLFAQRKRIVGAERNAIFSDDFHEKLQCPGIVN